MGAILRAFCRSAFRPVLLGLLAGLAWLVWGAGTATASSPVPDAGDLLKPVSSVLAKPRPVPEPPVLVSSGGTALATATSLADSAAPPANALAAPALPAVTGTVAAATALVPGLPDLPLVQAPLPLPLPEVPPLPEQLPPLLPGPLPVPDLLPVPGISPLPGLPPRTTPAPGPVPTAAPSLPASNAVAEGSNASVSPAPAGPVSLAATNAPRFVFGPAQDRPGLASPPEATASASGPKNGPQNPALRTPPALANGAGTANSGSAGGSQGAADLCGSWPSLPTATSGPQLSGAVTLPAGPSFDPGSSPD
jgi:hypothetical protein